MAPVDENVIVTLSGPQHPAALSQVLRVLGSHPLSDFGQLVVRDRFIATALLSSPHARDTVKDALFRAHEENISIDFTVTHPDAAKPNPSSLLNLADAHREDYVLTLFALGAVPMPFLAQILAVLVEERCRVSAIERLTEEMDDFMCLEIRIVVPVVEWCIGAVQRRLFELALRENRCDIALQKCDVMRRAKRLVVFDLSWTLVQCDTVNVLLEAAGVEVEGKGDGRELLERRARALKGVDVQVVQDKLDSYLEYTNGAVELCKGLKRLGCKLAVVSSGSKMAAERVRDKLGLHYAFGNAFEVDGAGRFTGRVVEPVVDADRKAELVQLIAMQENIQMEQVIAVGDGPVSAKMLAVAGMGVAFDQPISTDTVHGGRIASKSLIGVLYLLGVRGYDLQQVTRR